MEVNLLTKSILVIHTGGTIAMSEDKEMGTILTKKEHPLKQILKEINQEQDIEEMAFLNVPSPHITPEDMMNLTHLITRKLETEKYKGVVITHGTDTLEETAYFIDLTYQREEPIVITGSMRSSNEPGYDGPHNLLASIRTAASQDAKGKGVLVVLNDEIHTAKNVTKTHTSNIATFQSPQFGPIGIVTKRGIFFHHHPATRDTYKVSKSSKKTALLKVYAGMTPDLLEHIYHYHYDGLVLEALGQGNVPPDLIEPIKTLIQNKIPVVVVSRCFNGIVQDTYAYEGGGKQLKELGVIFSNGLNGQKARLKLMVALELTCNSNVLQDIFLK